jgi:hypothetical protein
MRSEFDRAKRTFARLAALAGKYDAQAIANAFAKRHPRPNFHFLSNYLSDVHELIEEVTKKPARRCAECGGVLPLDAALMKFCDARCKQKAYRKRVTAREQSLLRQASRVTALSQTSEAPAVTREGAS